MSTQEVLAELGVAAEGLTDARAQESLLKHGSNQLQEEAKISTLRVFLAQFNDFLIWILFAAALISGAIGKWESTLVILLVVMINAILGTVQHIKADEALQSLKAMSAPHATVIRNAQQHVIDAKDVVVGDIVILEAGDHIPADGRILESKSLTVNESALTGESVGAEKNTEAILGVEIAPGEKAPGAALNPGDQKNMVFAGTFVTHGRGSYVVTSVGMETQLGRIAHLLSDTKEKKTPLQVSLDVFGKKLAVVIIVLCAIVFAMNVFRGQPMMAALLFAVSLAVAAIPEALSSIVTIVLAIGTQKMAKDNAIIRKLHTVESLGCVSVICSDKTGTLTQNKMTVQKVYLLEKLLDADDLDISQPEQRDFLNMSMLCNDAVTLPSKEMGDPTEIALVNWGEQYRVDELRLREEIVRLAELPFDSDRKLMSSLHEIDSATRLLTKGALDVMLKRATRIMTVKGIRTITPADVQIIEQINHQLSSGGLRVLGFAIKNLDAPRELVLADEQDLVFYGLVSMMDPPRDESAAAVAACRAAGIKPIMITGDHRVTAAAIARQIGILDDPSEAVDGAFLENLSDEELLMEVPKYTVYARVSPEHKIRIVKAWQTLGHVVAMTGDGVNDAPALKQADVGIAMGITGTEVSKNAATMVLTDDNFSTIVTAVAAGRSIYNNIKNSIQFLLAGNTAGIISVFYASLIGLAAPFAPIHLLFINLITDSLPAIGIGLEESGSEVMNVPPRDAKEPILTRTFAIHILLGGLLIAFLTMSAYYIGLQTSYATASTMAFAVLCLARLVHGLNSRSQAPLTRRQFFGNRFVWIALVGGAAILFVVLETPFLMDIFEVVHLTAQQLLIVAGLSLVPLVVVQLVKRLTMLKQGV
jgi:Ca2+-transporting ATPase